MIFKCPEGALENIISRGNVGNVVKTNGSNDFSSSPKENLKQPRRSPYQRVIKNSEKRGIKE